MGGGGIMFLTSLSVCMCMLYMLCACMHMGVPVKASTDRLAMKFSS